MRLTNGPRSGRGTVTHQRDGGTTGGFPNRGSGEVGDLIGDPYAALATYKNLL